MIRPGRWREEDWAPAHAELPGMRPRSREHRRRRFQRRRHRAFIRSVYSLPSLATLGNLICGFASLYVSSLVSGGDDPWTRFWFAHQFTAAAYLLFLAMVFDALDGRLARFTRHTTDFGGQLDSLADMVSFGVAPAFLALELFKFHHPDDLAPIVTRLGWAIGAVYVSCAALRLARFNVSNKHGEQHHFSFLGLPSPGAAATIAAFILVQQDLWNTSSRVGAWPGARTLSEICVWFLPLLVFMTGLLMVSRIRYSHLINRYLRGRRSFGRLIVVLMLLLAIFVAHRYVLAAGTLIYVFGGAASSIFQQLRRKPLEHPAP